uniref:Receptor ligand binding region domain-containing protein n=1 Tax=Timema poppense TaxID=170557 RepID=A0A7R9D8I7_TIMPO|nr:unnamed protein product [Timema poppensis]
MVTIYTFSYPSCSGRRAPGLAADMHFNDKVIAFIGPACAFALEPVARLAAYWNRPIITGMGDQLGCGWRIVSWLSTCCGGRLGELFLANVRNLMLKGVFGAVGDEGGGGWGGGAASQEVAYIGVL